MSRPLAKIAYEAYAATTGGKTYDGKDMPKWEDLPLRTVTAWEAAVGAAVSAATAPLVSERDAWKQRAAQHGCDTEKGDDDGG
jgi:hypothetical protein